MLIIKVNLKGAVSPVPRPSLNLLFILEAFLPPKLLLHICKESLSEREGLRMRIQSQCCRIMVTSFPGLLSRILRSNNLEAGKKLV